MKSVFFLNRAKRLVRASDGHEWPEDSGTLLPPYGHDVQIK